MGTGLHRSSSTSIELVNGENTRERQSEAALAERCRDQPLEDLGQLHLHGQSSFQIRVWYCLRSFCPSPGENFLPSRLNSYSSTVA
ncbi:GOLD domain-containing protein [Psidium guajava]|nr:GOLD domain-containing protein [Psidium guajava]